MSRIQTKVTNPMASRLYSASHQRMLDFEEQQTRGTFNQMSRAGLLAADTGRMSFDLMSAVLDDINDGQSQNQEAIRDAKSTVESGIRLGLIRRPKPRVPYSYVAWTYHQERSRRAKAKAVKRAERLMPKVVLMLSAGMSIVEISKKIGMSHSYTYKLVHAMCKRKVEE